MVRRAVVVTSEHVRHWRSRKSRLHRGREGACRPLTVSMRSSLGTPRWARIVATAVLLRAMASRAGRAAYLSFTMLLAKMRITQL